jgi:hypothetical protein
MHLPADVSTRMNVDMQILVVLEAEGPALPQNI